MSDRENVVKAATGRMFDVAQDVAELAREVTETGVVTPEAQVLLDRAATRLVIARHALAKLEDPAVSDEQLLDLLRNPHRVEIRLVRRRAAEGAGESAEGST